jgi:outer membrane protein assembly factor BamB
MKEVGMRAYIRIQRAFCLILALLLVCPAPVLRADEVSTLTAVADAALQSALASTNDGTSAILRALGESSATMRSLVRFDLSSISSSAAIKVANLKMKVSSAPLASRTLAVHRITGATQWTENGVTWTSRDGTAPNNWATPGGDFSITPVSTQASGTTPGATIDWTVLSDGVLPNIPQDWLNNPSNNNGLLVKDVTETDPARAVVKSVYTGSLVSTGAAPPASLIANLGSCNGSTPTVDIFKSFLVFQTSNDLNRSVAAEIRGHLLPHACPSTPLRVQFIRSTNETSTVNISWYVVEFLRGVNVQHGANLQNSTMVNVPISPVVSTSQAFVLWSKTPVSTDSGYNQDDPIVADLTSTSNLQFRVNASNIGHAIDWEVVEFTNPLDIAVQRGNSAAMISGVSSINIPISPVDPATSFLLTSFRIPSGAASEGRLMLRGRLNNCTTTCNRVTVDRSTTGVAISEINYQVVSFSNGSSVQTGLQTFAGPSPGPADSSIPVPISSVDTGRSFAFTSTFSGGGANWGRSPLASPSAQSLGVAAFVTSLAPTTLTLTRQNTNAAADVSWYVAQMNDQPADGVSYSSREDSTPANRPLLDVHLLRDVLFGSNVSGVSEVTLNFTFPAGATSSNYQGALIARKTGAGAPTFTPTDGTAYPVGSQPVAGETVVSDANNFVAAPTNVAVLDENGPNSVVTPSTQYSYKSYSRDNNVIAGALIAAPPHYSLGSTATLTTLAGGGANKNWSYKTAGAALAPPGLDPGNRVVAASDDSMVHSMLASTGARNYVPGGATGTTGGPVQTRPSVVAQADSSVADCDPLTLGNQPCDLYYVGSNDGRVYAFNAVTGQQIWATPAPPSVGALVGVGGSIQGGVAVQLRKFANSAFQTATTSDLLFVGTRETSATANTVYALNGSTGAIVWAFSPGNLDGVNSTPAVDYTNNVVWVSSLSNGNTQPSLWKIDALAGTLMPSGSFSGLGDISGSPTLNFDNRVVYAVADSGDLHAVRNDIASCANTFTTGATSGTGFPIPLGAGAFNDVIFFTTTTAGASTVRKASFSYSSSCGGETFAAAGGYSYPSGIGTLSTPVIDPFTGVIYAGSSDGHLYKIDPTTGAVAGNRTVNLAAIIGDPSLDVFLNRIYVGDTAGRIYSFDVF